MKKWLDKYQSKGEVKNSLNRKVTCSNCGWSWKLSDGGEDPLTCHKCGGTIKMKNGGELDKYKEKGEVKSTFNPYANVNRVGTSDNTKVFRLNPEQVENAKKAAAIRNEKIVKEYQQRQSFIGPDKRTKAEIAKGIALKKEYDRVKAMQNSDLAKTFASFTPGNNIEAGVMGAETFANLNPIISGPILATSRLAPAIMHPTNNAYWGSGRSNLENAFGALGAIGDMGMVTPFFKGLPNYKNASKTGAHLNKGINTTKQFANEIITPQNNIIEVSKNKEEAKSFTDMLSDMFFKPEEKKSFGSMVADEIETGNFVKNYNKNFKKKYKEYSDFKKEYTDFYNEQVNVFGRTPEEVDPEGIMKDLNNPNYLNEILGFNIHPNARRNIARGLTGDYRGAYYNNQLDNGGRQLLPERGEGIFKLSADDFGKYEQAKPWEVFDKNYFIRQNKYGGQLDIYKDKGEVVNSNNPIQLPNVNFVYKRPVKKSTFDPYQQNAPIIDRGNFAQHYTKPVVQNIWINPNTGLPMTMNEAAMSKAQQIAQNQNPGSIRKTVPVSAGRRVLDIVSNPMTAAQQAIAKQPITGRGPRNILDNAVDLVNPITYAKAIKNTASNVVHPIETLKKLGNAGLGTLQYITEGSTNIPVGEGYGVLFDGLMTAGALKSAKPFLKTPLAKTEQIVDDLGNKYLPDVSKYYPKRFKENPNSYYRQVFSADEIENPTITRSMVENNDPKGVNAFIKGSEENFIDAGTNTPFELLRLPTTESLPYFNKGKVYFGKNYTKNIKDPELLIESKVPFTDYEDFYPAATNYVSINPEQVTQALQMSGDIRVLSPFSKAGHNLENYNFYKPHWLYGYKKVKFPNIENFKSEIDWENWITYKEDFHNNPEVIKHLIDIEKTTKANGTWMKNPDGSPFKGTPEQFVVQQSDNFKNAFEQGIIKNEKNVPRINYHYSDKEFDVFDEAFFRQGKYGKGIYTGLNPNLLNNGRLIRGMGLPPTNFTKRYSLYQKSTNPQTSYNDVYDKLYENHKNIQKIYSIPFGKKIYNKKLKNLIEENNKLRKQTLAINPETNEFDIEHAIHTLKDNYTSLDINHPTDPNYEMVVPFTNYPKSAEGNILFDMTNPNMHKGIIPYAIPTMLGVGALNQKQQGGVIEDDMGQWAHPGQVTRINSNKITMQGVPYPVTGVDNLGNTMVMQPGMNYTFPGQYVTEYPMMQQGGLIKYQNKGEVKKDKVKQAYIDAYNNYHNRVFLPETLKDRQNIYDRIRPSDYLDFNNYVRWAFNNQREEFDDPRSEEGFRIYLGLEDNPKYFSKSSYSPSINKNPNVKNYYKVDPQLEEEIFNTFKDKVKLNEVLKTNEAEVISKLDDSHKGYFKENGKEFIAPVSADKNILFGRPMVSNARVLGNFNVSHGKDKQGEYISYSDQYDFPDSFQKRMKGVPYSIYNRIYYPKKQTGGEMIKRADGSYSRRGLWDNIRANAGSGKRPTKEMLNQERKIRNQHQAEYGMEVMGNGGLIKYQEGKEVVNPNNPIQLKEIVIKPELSFEQKVDRWLGNPMAQAERDAEVKKWFNPKTKKWEREDPIDNVRHTSAGRYVAEAIANKTGNIPYVSNTLGYLGSNLLGAAHEANTYFVDPRWNDKKSGFFNNFKVITRTGLEDLYNNNIGAMIGVTPFTPSEKTRIIKNLSNNNLIPDGYGEADPFHKGIKSNYKQGGQKMPPQLAYARFAAAGNLNQLGRYGYQDGGDIPTIEGPSGYMNEDNVWIVDNETIKRQAQELGAKKVLTEGGSLIIFDDNWNIVAADDNPDAPYKQGGSVTLNAGGENHRIYVKTTNRGEGEKGHIMVNHPTMDKGMWDTIDLTKKSGATTIAQGVAATKKWHMENPYMKKYGGDINFIPNYKLGGAANYTVKRGETLGGIAKKNTDISYTKLANLNNIKNPDYIQAGQNLYVPYRTSNVATNVIPTLLRPVQQPQIKPFNVLDLLPKTTKQQVVKNQPVKPKITTTQPVNKKSIPIENNKKEIKKVDKNIKTVSLPKSNNNVVNQYNITSSDANESNMYSNRSYVGKVDRVVPDRPTLIERAQGIWDGINQRAIGSRQEEDKEAIVKKPLPKSKIKHGFKELYTVRDMKGGAKDSLLASTYTGDNDTGTVFKIGNMVANLRNPNQSFENVEGVAHFIMDGDVLPNQMHTEPYYDARGELVRSNVPGKFINSISQDPNVYNMYYKPNNAGNYNIVYKQNKFGKPYLDKGWLNDLTVRSVPYSNIDWEGQGPSTGYFTKSNYIPLKNNMGATSIPYKNKSGYSRFSGGSGIYIYKDPITNREIQTNVTGSPETLKQIGESIINENNIDPNTLTFLYHDMGSYSAKPKARPDGTLNYNQWRNYNTYNRGRSGAPIMIPRQEYGGEPMYAEGGGIPERYRNMGFTNVGAKKQSTRPGKKWMVLAKKGDDYKVVHGGYKGMQDFKQHHSEQRKENFWSRMGGRNSSKATDPFSPLYWHKRFGTWEQGGEIPKAQNGLVVKNYIQQTPYVNNSTNTMPSFKNFVIDQKPVIDNAYVYQNNRQANTYSKPSNVTKNKSNKYNDIYEKTKKYLARDVFAGVPLKAEDFANAMINFEAKTGYKYPLDLLLSQAQIETHFGKNLKSKHNYFNVGNDDDGNVINFASPEESILNYMNLMYNDYLQKGKKDYHDLLVDKKFVNYQGNRYASNPTYERELKGQSEFINRFLNKKKKGGQYMAVGGQNVMNPIVKKDNRNWLEYLKN